MFVYLFAYFIFVNKGPLISFSLEYNDGYYLLHFFIFLFGIIDQKLMLLFMFVIWVDWFWPRFDKLYESLEFDDKRGYLDVFIYTWFLKLFCV